MEFCECVHKLDITLGHVVELVLINNGFTMNSMHPMHLHGQYFRVVALEKVKYMELINESKTLLRKSTVESVIEYRG